MQTRQTGLLCLPPSLNLIRFLVNLAAGCQQPSSLFLAGTPAACWQSLKRGKHVLHYFYIIVLGAVYTDIDLLCINHLSCYRFVV